MLHKKGSDLFIVDNSDNEWKVYKYLHDWCDISNQFDIATAFFEIGSLLSLDKQWQKLDKIRILMGDEVSKRTHEAFTKGLNEVKSKLDSSIEKEKIENNFLKGVPAIVEAIRNKKIECKIYRKKKFHAKAYITHAKFDVVGAAALVGSSNFTYPGLHDNVELNIQIRREVKELQEWFNKYWEDAEDVTPEILTVIERHTREFTPFEVFLKSLYEYYKGNEPSADVWERMNSVMYKELDLYQIEGYKSLLKVATKYKGAFLCDSTGLGKTYIGLMLLERLLFKERKNVALIVPKSAKESVWEKKIAKYFPNLVHGYGNNLKIFSHTDLLREAGDRDYPKEFKAVMEQAEAMIIDEAHNFRNHTSRRYKKLREIIGNNKMVFLITATPINNSILDLLHQIELFTQGKEIFKDSPIGIHSLRGHFRRLENAIDKMVTGSDNIVSLTTDEKEAEKILRDDKLFREIVVQRSRAYAVKSSEQNGGRDVIFPVRNDPKVITYSLMKVYGDVFEHFKNAFSGKDPLLKLTIYYPYKYYLGDEEKLKEQRIAWEVGRMKQVVALIRTIFLKRFESSVEAFRESCRILFLRLYAFIKVNSEYDFKKIEQNYKDIVDEIKIHYAEQNNETEDSVTDEFFEYTEKLDINEFNVSKIIEDTIDDLKQLSKFLNLLSNYDVKDDQKINKVIHELKENPELKGRKVIIFTEFKATAKYIFKEMKKEFSNVYEIDGDTALRSEVIGRFSPYYNDTSSYELKQQGKQEIDILISTDVLSEGLNLQDAAKLINYDIHWNPVRLIQRIGRIDRRLDQKIEEKIIADHPELKDERGTITFWNCLPPAELNQLLSLYHRVTNKTLKISKTFGIEGKKLLTPDDDLEALREFNAEYEGTATPDEEIALEYQKFMKENPELAEKLPNMPLRIFSGKKDVLSGLFFCYCLPGLDLLSNKWTEEAGYTKWYFLNDENGQIEERFPEIYKIIKCEKNEQRYLDIDERNLKEKKKKVEKYINDFCFKKTQAPMDVKPILKCWMQIAK